jgi:hypothetical protein
MSRRVHALLSFLASLSLACTATSTGDGTSNAADPALAVDPGTPAPASAFSLGATSANLLFSLIDATRFDVAVQAGAVAITPSASFASAIDASGAAPQALACKSTLGPRGRSITSATLDALSVRLGDSSILVEASLNASTDFAAIDDTRVAAELVPSPSGLVVRTVSATVSCAACAADDAASLRDNLAAPFGQALGAFLAQPTVKEALLEMLVRYMNLGSPSSFTAVDPSTIAIRHGHLAWRGR